MNENKTFQVIHFLKWVYSGRSKVISLDETTGQYLVENEKNAIEYKDLLYKCGIVTIKRLSDNEIFKKGI